MELRCHNCGTRVDMPAGQAARPQACPSCGAELAPAARPRPGTEARPAKKTLKRIFEPIPRPVVYAAGFVLTLLILAPFWLYLLSDAFPNRPVIYSDDSESINVPPPTTESAYTPPPELLQAQPVVLLDQYRGLRLDATREELQQRHTIRLVNTRGMVPEIYEVARTGDIEQVVAHFYNNLLKQFQITLREQRATPEAIEQELRAEFGPPHERVTSTDSAAATPGIGIPGHIVTSKIDDLASRLAAYPYRRTLAWQDDANRVDATIYYTSPDPAKCVSVLSVRVSAAAWLRSDRPRLGTIGAAPTEPSSQIANGESTSPPPRLFP